MWLSSVFNQDIVSKALESTDVMHSSPEMLMIGTDWELLITEISKMGGY